MKIYYDIRFQTQTGNLIYNDCGEASLSIVTERVWGKAVSIREWQNATGRHGQLDTPEQLKAGADNLGYPYRTGYADLDFVRQAVHDGYLVIALIQYEKLPLNFQAPVAYRGGHYVTVHGVTDDDIIYTDTLYVHERHGKAKHLSHKSFAAAYMNRYLMPEVSIKAPVIPEPLPPITIPEEEEMTDDQVRALTNAIDKHRKATKFQMMGLTLRRETAGKKRYYVKNSEGKTIKYYEGKENQPDTVTSAEKSELLIDGWDWIDALV
jgi:hypothetical protein